MNVGLKYRYNFVILFARVVYLRRRRRTNWRILRGRCMPADQDTRVKWADWSDPRFAERRFCWIAPRGQMTQSLPLRSACPFVRCWTDTTPRSSTERLQPLRPPHQSAAHITCTYRHHLNKFLSISIQPLLLVQKQNDKSRTVISFLPTSCS